MWQEVIDADGGSLGGDITRVCGRTAVNGAVVMEKV